MVVFDLGAPRTLWVSCLELFSRTYGASQEIKRVLVTFGWSEVQERLLPPPGYVTTADRPVVKIPHRLVPDDAYFLARLRHDPYTERAARLVYSKLDEVHPSASASGVLLEVRPWFEGPAQLLVEGEWLSDAFLAHRIVGGSVPAHPAPCVVREHEASAGAGSADPSLAPAPPRSTEHPPSHPVELTADRPPGRRAGHVEVHDDPFIVVGPRPSLTFVSVQRAPRERSGSGGELLPPVEYATADATGTDAGVGQARIHAPVAEACDGFLLGVWNAFRALRASTPGFDLVTWYTFDRGFQLSSPPELLRFQPYREPKRPRRRWMWLDSQARWPCRHRGLLVLRCVLHRRIGYVSEIERRTDASGAETETFSGLVFVLDSEHALDAWLRHLLCGLRDKRGVFDSFLSDCPGEATTFHHPPRDSDDFSNLAARNALSKMRTLLSPLR